MLKHLLTLSVVAALSALVFPALAEKTKEPSAEAEPEPTAEVDRSYRTAARGGIITGTVLEGLGLAGMLAGSLTAAISDSGEDAGLAVMIAAGATFTVGGFVSTVAHTSRHRAYEAAEISTRKNMPVFAWLFTAGTAALWAVAVSEYAEYVDAEDEWNGFGDAMGMVLSSSFSMICEILNLSVFRVLWRRDMNRAEEDKMLTLTVAPILRGPGLALAGTF